MKKTVKLQIDQYFTPKGQHTCSLSPHEDCPMLRFSSFGQKAVCALQSEDTLLRGDSKKHGKGMGFLIPGAWCPFKKGKIE